MIPYAPSHPTRTIFATFRPEPQPEPQSPIIAQKQGYDHEADMPYGDPIVLNKKLIDRLRTRYGGFTGASLASIGVRRYPLKKNWWKHFLGAEISRDTYYNALLGREIYRGGRK